MSDVQQRLPNLYRLLGLTPLESDRARIVAALKQLQARARAGSPSQGGSAAPEELARWQKLLSFGQLLLDPKRKESYDRQWQAAYQTSPATASSSHSPVAKPFRQLAADDQRSLMTANKQLHWEMASLEALLPPADPHASFDMADYLRHSQPCDPASAQSDLNKLIALLGGQPLPSDAATEPVDSLEIDSAIRIRPSADGQHTTGGLAKRLHKKQQRGLLLGTAGLAAGFGGLTMLYFFLNPSVKSAANGSPVAQTGPVIEANNSSSPLDTSPSSLANDPQPQTASSKAEATGAATSPSPATTFSSLPVPGQLDKPPEILAKPLPRTETDGNSGDKMMTDAMASPLPAAEPASSQPAPTDLAPKPSPVTTPDTTPNTAMETAMVPSPAKETTANGTVSDAPLTAREKAAWKKSMTQIRNALGGLNVATATQELEQLKSLAKTQLQREQLERLKTVADLVQVARQAIVDSISSADPAQELKIGKSTIVSIIEGDAERLVVKVSGRTQRYPLAQIPARMGEALIDLQAGLPHAQKQAAKGAYFVVHPKNDLVLADGRRLLEEAAQAGAITPEVARFYDDDYSLGP